MKYDKENLWLQHKDALLGFIRTKVKNEEDAKDILQNVLLKMYNFCLSCSGIRNVKAWLYQVTKNAIIDFYRRRKNFAIVEEIPEIEEFNSADEVLHQASLFVEPLLSMLPDDYAVPLRMSELNGMKQEDVASQLNIGFSATRTRIHRARKMLRDKLLEMFCVEFDSAGKLHSFKLKEGQQLPQNFEKYVQADKLTA